MTSPQELQAEMERLLEAGDTKVLEAYVLAHFAELPEDVQGKVLLGFYTEALEKEAVEAHIANLQKEGMEALQKLSEIQAEASTPPTAK